MDSIFSRRLWVNHRNKSINSGGFNNGSTNGRNGCGGGGSEIDDGNGSSATNGIGDDPNGCLDSADGALGGGGATLRFRVLKKADVDLKVGGKPKQYSVVIKVLPTDDPGQSETQAHMLQSNVPTRRHVWLWKNFC